MKRVNITYFVHGTTPDNQNHKASGWFDVGLSELGRKQSAELKNLIKGKKFDVVFCSDLKRAVESARIAFDDIQIILDKRLRECNYGDLNGADTKKVESMMLDSINKSFPNGESYKEVENRVRDFLKDLLEKHSGKNVAIVSHRAPQLALEVILRAKSWKQAMKEDWRRTKRWQPGWDYVLEEGVV